MATCRELFAADLKGDLAIALDNDFPECGCEACALSPFGPVDGAETLIRLVFAPQHFDEKKNRPKPAVLSHAESIGMSTFRDEHTTNDELLRVASALLAAAKASNPKADFKGVIKFKAAKPKTARPEEGSVVYCIYDSPSGGVEGHSDVFQRVSASDEPTRLARRRWLFDELEFEFELPTDFRGGILVGI